MTARSRLPAFSPALALLLALALSAQPAAAQDRKPKAAAERTTSDRPASPSAAKPSKRKKVGTKDAVIVVRDVLVLHGYQVVRVEQKNGAEVIHFRRGNNGRGRGLGPVEKMIVRPKGDVVVFESAPSKVLVDVNIRLGL